MGNVKIEAALDFSLCDEGMVVILRLPESDVVLGIIPHDRYKDQDRVKKVIQHCALQER